MSNPNRDEQFRGYAKAELQEIDDAIGNAAKRMARNGEIDEKAFALELGMILTRRAYDLVQHTIGYTLEYLDECGRQIPGGMGKRIVPSIPDMAELPEEQERMSYDNLRDIFKPQLRTIDLVAPQTVMPGLVDHNGVPYKILSWRGNVAHCQELTAQEFADLMTLYNRLHKPEEQGK